MSHARIEEVSDSDPSEGDISDVASDASFDEREILRARPTGPKPSSTLPKPSNPTLTSPSNIPSFSDGAAKFNQTVDESKYKNFQCVYPIYFDKNRSRREGRMVGIENAVENPLARGIVDACAGLGLECLFEPMKIHPKDWGNPGRVKVKLRGGRNGSIKNKHHLYALISTYLLANPTTPNLATLVKVPGCPVPDLTKPYPEPAVPKGWKINKILPHYSPAMSGGGVSENFFKDMMNEMQNAGGAGALPPGMPDLSAMQAMMGGMGGPSGAGGGGQQAIGQGAKKEKKKKK